MDAHLRYCSSLYNFILKVYTNIELYNDMYVEVFSMKSTRLQFKMLSKII